MKIVQSFWTKPFMQSPDTDGNRFNGGWPSRKINYYSIILSCLRLKKFYPEVELVTDELGKEILIDKLGLPYTNCSTDLEHINHYHPGLWALGKIHAYAMQEEPFLHVDLDIFIHQSFSKELHQAELVAQNIETRTSDYKETVDHILNKFDFIPAYMDKFRNYRFVPAVNAGVFGGKNVGFFKNYANEVFNFLAKNATSLQSYFGSKWSNEYLNVFFEQMLFYGLTLHQSKPIHYLFPEHDDTPKLIGYMHLENRHQGYVHAYAGFKKKRVVYELIQRDLEKNYPDYFDRVNQLLAKFEL